MALLQQLNNLVIHSRMHRIFLGGKDGCLYEFAYRAEKGWWGQRTQKINHSSGNLRSVPVAR
jgi:hypothetical protein